MVYVSHPHEFSLGRITAFRVSAMGLHFWKFFIYIFKCFSSFMHSLYYINNTKHPTMMATLPITYIYSF